MAKRETTAQRGDKEFLYNGFSVMVPHSILEEWEANKHEMIKMIYAVQTLFLRYRTDWVMAKLEPIREGIRCKSEFSPQNGDSLLEMGKKLENHGVKDRVLELLRYKHYRDWHKSPIKDLFTRAVTMAALDGDKRFFKRLYEKLRDPPIPYKPPRKLSPLSELLLFNWVGEGICFCWFTAKALQDFLKETEVGWEPDAIRQARDRLKLPKLSRRLVRSVGKDGENRILLRSAKPDLVLDGVEGLEPRAQGTDSARTIRAIEASRRKAATYRRGVHFASDCQRACFNS
jgi:hypothetical protein